MDSWERLSVSEAMELLGPKVADTRSRAFAVKKLASLVTEELNLLMLQLVQMLKHETYLDNPLIRMLLSRCVKDRGAGHYFYWSLKAEMYDSRVSQRFGVYLETYLRLCGSSMRAELCRQLDVVEKLEIVAQNIKDAPSSTRQEVLQTSLNEMLPRLPACFDFPADPRVILGELDVAKCKVLSSKKLPLWLVFKCPDACGQPTAILFKCGDDLRQDVLTLQMIRLMDKMWKSSCLSMRLSPYGCVATGDEVGFIEVVPSSNTIANIEHAFGGAKGAFKKDPIDKWLLDQTAGDNEKYSLAKMFFLTSLAAYCVATYILGIGDRHNDNVMMCTTGHFFHIDFGHFLGNIKKKFGIKRERAPFVFTPDFAYVLGKYNKKKDGHALYDYFCTLSAKAYNIIREKENSYLITVLFSLMVYAGIPELTSASDLAYLTQAMQASLSEEDGDAYFRKLVTEALSTKTTQINNYIHILAHKKSEKPDKKEKPRDSELPSETPKKKK